MSASINSHFLIDLPDQAGALLVAYQPVSSRCALLCFKAADDACPLLSRMWVAAVPYCVSGLLMMPVLCSPESEWLLCLAVFQACWWCLSSTLQFVSALHLFTWLTISLLYKTNQILSLPSIQTVWSPYNHLSQWLMVFIFLAHSELSWPSSFDPWYLNLSFLECN